MQRELLKSGDGAQARFQVSRTELAQLFGVSQMQISRDCKAGMEDAAKVARGVYDLGAAVQWKLGRLADAAAGARKDPGYDDEARALKAAQARKARIEADMMESNLVPFDQVAQALNTAAAAFGTALDMLGHRHANDLAAMNDPGAILELLQDHAREIREGTAHALTTEVKRLERRRTAGQRRRDNQAATQA